MPRRHRKKGPACPNCGHALRPEFEYCPHCGQENHDLRVPFRTFLYEFVENITHFDTKLWSTVKALVTQPGRLTKDFVEGKRARYVHPARFYIFTSVIFFALLSMQMDRNMQSSERLVNARGDVDHPAQQRRSTLDDLAPDPRLDMLLEGTRLDLPIDRPFYRAARERLQKGQPAALDSLLRTGRMDDTLRGTRRAVQAVIDALPDADSLDVPYHRTLNSIQTSFSGRSDERFFIRGRMSQQELDSLLGADADSLDWWKKRAILSMGRLDLKSDQGRHQFSGAIAKSFSVIMFLLMPFAAVLLLWCFAPRRYYWEHLIFSVHVHTTVFLFLIVLLSITLLAHIAWAGWAQWLLVAGLVGYAFVALRTVYGHSWGGTLWRAVLVGIPYTIVFLILMLTSLVWGLFSL